MWFAHVACAPTLRHIVRAAHAARPRLHPPPDPATGVVGARRRYATGRHYSWTTHTRTLKCN